MTYYWIIKLDDIQTFFGIVGILLLFATMPFAMVGFSECDEDYMKKARNIFAACLMFFLTTTLLPSTKQMCAVIAAPYVFENKDLQETVKNIPEITKLGTKYLKNVLTAEKGTEKND